MDCLSWENCGCYILNQTWGGNSCIKWPQKVRNDDYFLQWKQGSRNKTNSLQINKSSFSFQVGINYNPLMSTGLATVGLVPNLNAGQAADGYGSSSISHFRSCQQYVTWCELPKKYTVKTSQIVSSQLISKIFLPLVSFKKVEVRNNVELSNCLFLSCKKRLLLSV